MSAYVRHVRTCIAVILLLSLAIFSITLSHALTIVHAQTSLLDILKNFIISELYKTLFQQASTQPTYTYNVPTQYTGKQTPQIYTSQSTYPYTTSLPSLPYSNKQFLLTLVRVLKYPHTCKGTALLRLCFLHNSPYILYDLKISAGLENGNVLLLEPSSVRLVQPYSIICTILLLNVSSCGNHMLSITFTWSKVYKPRIVMNGMIVPGEEIRTVPDSQTLTIPITIMSSPKIVVYAYPNVVPAESTNYIYVKVCNEGNGTAYDLNIGIAIVPEGVSVSIPSGEPLSLTIPELSAGACIVKRIKITVVSGSSAYPYSQSGAIVMKIMVMYFDKELGLQNATYTSYIGVLKSGFINVLPLTLYLNTSSLNTVKIKVCNLMNYILNNVTINIVSVTSAILMNSSSIRLGSLMPFECKLIKIRLAVPRMSMPTPVSLSYIVTYGTALQSYAQERGVLTFQVVEQPRIVVTQITLAPKVVTVGEGLVISVQLSNTGTATAYDVNVTIVPDAHFVPISSTYTFIGSLAPQAQTVASFTLNATRPGLGECKIVIMYVDEYGREHAISRVVKIEIRPATSMTSKQASLPSAHTSYTLLVVLAIACVAPIVGTVVYMFRKRS